MNRLETPTTRRSGPPVKPGREHPELSVAAALTKPSKHSSQAHAAGSFARRVMAAGAVVAVFGVAACGGQGPEEVAETRSKAAYECGEEGAGVLYDARSRASRLSPSNGSKDAHQKTARRPKSS